MPCKFISSTICNEVEYVLVVFDHCHLDLARHVLFTISTSGSRCHKVYLQNAGLE